MMIYFWNKKDHRGTREKAKVKSQKYVSTFGPQVKVKIHKYFWTTGKVKIHKYFWTTGKVPQVKVKKYIKDLFGEKSVKVKIRKKNDILFF